MEEYKTKPLKAKFDVLFSDPAEVDSVKTAPKSIPRDLPISVRRKIQESKRTLCKGFH